MDNGVMPKLHIKEMDPRYGDLVKTITVEEARELDHKCMVTVFPNGEVAHSFEELLAITRNYTHLQEVDVVRFPPLAGG